MNNAINLLPCPMCGCNSITIKNEQPTDNSGGYFIECPDCGTSTSLRYACGDDPMPLLAEQWNRRTSTQHLRQIAEPAQAGEPVVSMLTFVNGEPAKCGCRFSHSDGGGEYSNVGSVTLCAKHAGNRTERASPFMWAIQEPGGGAYMDEGCVSSVREDVQAEVDGLNSGLDADDDPYKVVPVYLAAAPQAVQAAVLAHLDDLLDDAAAHIYPSDLRKCQTSECTVKVASVRTGNREERSVPLFSREQVVEAFEAALAAQAKQGGA